jgi:hypothetical protein
VTRDVKERKKKDRRKLKRVTQSGGDDVTAVTRKTRAQQQQKPPKVEADAVKTEIKEEPADEKPSPVKLEPLKVDEEDLFSEDDKSPLMSPGRASEASTPIKGQHKSSPTGGTSKLGLPDNKGLIVGVNTINYDASSSVRNKTKVSSIAIVI